MLRPSPNALVAHLQGEAVLLHLGTKRYFRLNETAAAAWRVIAAAPSHMHGLTAALAAEFETSAESIAGDVAALVHDLQARDLVILSDEGPSGAPTAGAAPPTLATE